jgi:PRTRC genetic system protein B
MMEVINRVEAQSFVLSAAILLHTQELRGAANSYDRGTRRAFATIHPVREDDKGGKVIGEGSLVSHQALSEIVEQLAPQRGLNFLPTEVLAACATGIVWWRRPAPAKVWFNTQDALGQKNGTTPQPGLVFAATAAGWWVWAVKGSERPTPKTRLYQAPYYNVNGGGSICTGNVDLPDGLGIDSIQGYEAAFWGSRFTHPNIHDKRRLSAWPGGAEKLWLALLAGRRRCFPEQALVELRLDLESAISEVAGRGGVR